MTYEQAILFSIMGGVFALLLWGKLRYDLVAFGALCIALVLGVVEKEAAFSGFSNKATVIIALVLIISKGLFGSGAIEIITRKVIDSGRSLSTHIGIMSALAAVLSAVMNNVAALALLMPVDIQAARKAKRSPALSLMPISFASILGGMVTLIGTPPNILVAEQRQAAFGEPFSMFDFTPVGAACAVAGVIFIMLFGWRLIPADRAKHDTQKELENLEGFIAEAEATEGSPVLGQKIADLDEIAEKADVAIIGMVRRGNRLPGMARREEIRKGDILVLQASPDAIEQFIGAQKLKYAGADKHGGALAPNLKLIEVVVPEGARIEGRSALSMRLLYRHGVTLMGVSREGKRFRERVRKLEIEAGDLLLLLGPEETVADVANRLGTLPLAERGLQVLQRDKAWLAVGLFSIAIAVASLELLDLSIALACCATLYVALKIVPLTQLYDSVQWPVIILLGGLIPIGEALTNVGGSKLIADGIVYLSQDFQPLIVLTILMVITMTLSDVLNNTATVLVAAPIGIEIAAARDVSADPFLMAVAVAASCAFLTPIGHKNNTIIMGPGGYRFSDYWRMGLPLEILIIIVGVLMIWLVWPFYPA